MIRNSIAAWHNGTISLFADAVEVQTRAQTEQDDCERVVVDQRTKFRLEITFAIPENLAKKQTHHNCGLPHFVGL